MSENSPVSDPSADPSDFETSEEESSSEDDGISLEEEDTNLSVAQPSELTAHPKRMRFIASADLNRIIEIMAKCDQVHPEEVIRKLNHMVAKKTLLIVPQIGRKYL